MSYESYIEDLLDDVKDFVGDNVQTYIDGITAEKGDGINLDAFREIEVGESDPFGCDKYPAIHLDPVGIETQFLASGYDELSATIAAMIVFSPGSPANSVRKMLRYTEAFRQLINAYKEIGINTFDVDRENIVIAYNPREQQEVAVKAAFVQFKVIADIPN